MQKNLYKRTTSRFKFATLAVAYALVLAVSLVSPMTTGQAAAFQSGGDGGYGGYGQPGPTVISVPAAPSVTDPCGPNNASWNKPQDTYQLDWSLNNGVLTVETKQGFTFANHVTSHNYGTAQDSNTPCVVVVQVPPTPSVTDPCGSNNASWVMPADTDQFDWFMQNGSLKVSTKAGYKFPGNQTTYSYGAPQDSNTPCSTVIPVPPTPSATDPCGPNNASWVKPDNTSKITWTITNGHLIATAKYGYAFPGNASSYDYGVAPDSNVPCVKEVRVTPPTVKSDPCGTKNDTYTIPYVEGVKFYVNGQYKAPGTHDTNGVTNLHITAVALQGYKIVGNDCWDLQFDDEPCVIIVHPKDPTVKSDPCGTKYDAYYIPYVEGVKYYVNGEYVSPGMHYTDGATKLHITAKAQQGYKLVGEDCWDLWFTNKPCLIPIRAVAPTSNDDECGTAGDTYTIPDVEGIDYYVNGEYVEPGTYPTDGATHIKITAEAGEGYKLYGQDCWKLEFSDYYCETEYTTPADPTVVCGPNNDLVVLTTNEPHVTYTQTGWADGSNTVTATADSGYYFAGTEGETTLTWTYSDENTSCGQVLGETTTTPSTPVKVTAQLENTGASITLPMLLSTGVLGLAVMTFLQASNKESKLLARARRLFGVVRNEFAQPFVTI